MEYWMVIFKQNADNLTLVYKNHVATQLNTQVKWTIK